MAWPIPAMWLLGTLPIAAVPIPAQTTRMVPDAGASPWLSVTGRSVNRRDHVAIEVPISTGPAGGAAAIAQRRCGDSLADMGKKPAHLVYAGCRYAPDEQGKPLRATYRVSGRYAAETESFLIKAVGLNRLRLSCCQWDSPPRWFKDAQGRQCSITMTSIETVFLTRASWRSIPLFEVEVETFTQEI